VGRGGDDTIVARAGSDLVCGGGGDDLIDLGVDPDRAKGGEGGDGIFGDAGNDRLLGQGGSDGLFGDGGPDVSEGGGGGDFIQDDTGDDKLIGGPGNEVLIGDQGDDRIVGGPGNLDLASYVTSLGPVTVDLADTTAQPTGDGLDRLTAVEGLEGSSSADQLYGDDLSTPLGNGLFGNGGDDLLDGRQEVDFLFGEGGDDDAYGGEGPDDLTGGEAGESAGDFASGGPDADVCREFESDDGTCEALEPRVGDAGGWTTVVDRGRPVRVAGG
jgi:Ca2+-binding RTX toxin-like protein